MPFVDREDIKAKTQERHCSYPLTICTRGGWGQNDTPLTIHIHRKDLRASKSCHSILESATMRLSSSPVILLLSAISSATEITPAPSLPQQTAASSVPSLESSATPLPLEYYEKNDPRLELRAAPPPAAAPAPAPAPAPAAPVVPGAPAPVAPAPVPGAAAPAPVAPVVGVGGAGAVPPAAQSGNPTQVPSITVFMQATMVGGVTQQVQVTYTQKFSDIPSQGPSPSQGKIGLGTITGTVGAVNTKEAKQAAAKNAGSSCIAASNWGVVRIGILGFVSVLVAMGGLVAL